MAHFCNVLVASDEDDGKEASHGRAALSDHNKCSRGPSKYNFIQQLGKIKLRISKKSFIKLF